MGGWGVGWEAVVLALLLGLGVGELEGKEEGRQCNHRHPREDEVRRICGEWKRLVGVE